MDLEGKIRLIKLYGDKNDLAESKFRIFLPLFLVMVFFPPLILGEFFLGKIRSWEDLKLLPFMWVKAIMMRYYIWKAAIRERYFII